MLIFIKNIKIEKTYKRKTVARRKQCTVAASLLTFTSNFYRKEHKINTNTSLQFYSVLLRFRCMHFHYQGNYCHWFGASRIHVHVLTKIMSPIRQGMERILGEIVAESRCSKSRENTYTSVLQFPKTVKRKCVHTLRAANPSVKKNVSSLSQKINILHGATRVLSCYVLDSFLLNGLLQAEE
jgi:hypothetical protein